MGRGQCLPPAEIGETQTYSGNKPFVSRTTWSLTYPLPSPQTKLTDGFTVSAKGHGKGTLSVRMGC